MAVDVTILIPAYEEASSVAAVICGAAAALRATDLSFEILVVDDGSSDGTGDAARTAGATVISHPYNRGYGAALKSGMRAARGQTIVMLDADGQHSPDDIAKLLGCASQYDLVIGARPGTGGSPLWRKPGKLLLRLLANNLTGRRIPDLNSGFRAIRRDIAMRFLPIMPDGFSFSTTSTIAALRGGHTVSFVPIEVKPRKGTSSVTAADGLRTILLIVRIVTLFAPLRVFLPVSLATLLIGSAFILHSYVNQGEASLKGIVVILAGLLFFLFGILVDQVVAIRRGEHIS